MEFLLENLIGISVATPTIKKEAAMNKMGYKRGMFKNLSIGMLMRLLRDTLWEIILLIIREIGIEIIKEKIVAIKLDNKDSFK